MGKKKIGSDTKNRTEKRGTENEAKFLNLRDQNLVTRCARDLRTSEKMALADKNHQAKDLLTLKKTLLFSNT